MPNLRSAQHQYDCFPNQCKHSQNLHLETSAYGDSTARHGTVRHGMARHSTAWHGTRSQKQGRQRSFPLHVCNGESSRRLVKWEGIFYTGAVYACRFRSLEPKSGCAFVVPQRTCSVLWGLSELLADVVTTVTTKSPCRVWFPRGNVRHQF